MTWGPVLGGVLGFIIAYGVFVTVEYLKKLSIGRKEVKRNILPEYWLESMRIINYDICDGIVHVVGDVDIMNKGLTEIPVQFGYVGGDFNCSNNQLTSLKGCPTEIGGEFDCTANQLTSLKGGPDITGTSYYCSNNRLESLKNAPSEVGGAFRCAFNRLTSIDCGPMKVNRYFYCLHNDMHEEPEHSHISTARFEWE